MEESAQSRRETLGALSDAGRRVFTTVLTRGPISRIDIAKTTGLSQAAVTKAITPLIADGLVGDADTAPARASSPGRPASPIAVRPSALSLIGVKVNDDELIGVLTDARTGIAASKRIPLTAHDPETVIAAVIGLVGRLAGYATAPVCAIGVSVSGDVDPASGTVRDSAILGWTDVALGDRLTEALAIPVTIENDVHALTFGEHWFGVGLGTASFAIVTIGRGVGSGLHLGGEVVSGAYGVVGEVGHIPVASPERVCRCGRRGCTEAVASTAAITERISRAHGREVSIGEAVRLAHEGHPSAVEAFTEAGSAIGTAIATLINIVGPELVIIGGEAVANFDLFERSLRRAIDDHAFGAAARCDIVARPHTFEDWARGAAASAIGALIYQ